MIQRLKWSDLRIEIAVFQVECPDVLHAGISGFDAVDLSFFQSYELFQIFRGKNLVSFKVDTTYKILIPGLDRNGDFFHYHGFRKDGSFCDVFNFRIAQSGVHVAVFLQLSLDGGQVFIEPVPLKYVFTHEPGFNAVLLVFLHGCAQYVFRKL
ncbi:hypothetical protein ES703_104462 [subsurface metagenome]